MKSVNKIFATNKDAESIEEVQTLIEEYENLQNEYYDLEEDKKRLKNRENLFLELVRDIQNSIEMEFKTDHDNQKLNLEHTTDYKACLDNLYKYINAYCRDNRIYL